MEFQKMIFGIAVIGVAAIAYLTYRLFVWASDSPETRNTIWPGIALFDTVCWGGFAVFLVLTYVHMLIL